MPVIPLSAKDYREYTKNTSPGFLKGTLGERLVGALHGLFADFIAECVQEAVLARFITSPTFLPDSALGPIGEGRLLPRYAFETDASYQEAVQRPWSAWSQAGTAAEMARQFARTGVTVTVKRNGETDWQWDYDTDDWSRFWLLVTDHPWPGDSNWGDRGDWGDGGVWGLADVAGTAGVETLRAVVRQWKPAHIRCASIVVIVDNSVWANPSGYDWDQPENRSEGALYIDPVE